MKNRVLLLTFLLPVTISVFSQEISRLQADSIIKALKIKKQGMERIDLLLNLAQFHIFKSGELQIDFDSAKIFIDEAAVLNKSVHSPDANGYLALTESYLINEKGQKDEAKKLAEKAVAILETASNKHYLGRACYELSRYYGYRDPQELGTRILLVERAIKCFEQAGTLDQNAYSLEMLGDLYNLNEEFDKALQVLSRALTAYTRIGYPKLQGVYVLLGQCNSFLGNYAQALFYMLKALKVAQTAGDTSMQMCQINLSLGVIYQRIGNNEMSAKYLGDGLEVAKTHRDEEAIGFLAVNISSINYELGQYDKALRVLDFIPTKIRVSKDAYAQNNIALCYLQAYTALRQFDKARYFCDTLLSYAGKSETVKDLEKSSYSAVAKYYIAIKQFQKARYYLEKNVELNKNKPLGLSKIKDEQLWYKLDSAQGNFQSAFNHLYFYKSKMDSIFSLNKVRQLQVLGVEYETAIKDDSIKAKISDINLLTQKNQLQEANLKQAGLIKNITIIGIILVLIIMGLLYRQYLHKQKSNKVVTIKNEQLQELVADKEWLLKEIHHRVKNNLQIIMSLLDSQTVYINDDAALTAINDSQRRVQTISLIHQRLYQSENAASIDMPQYIDELISYLRDSFGASNHIVFEQDIDPLKLDVAQAIPLGLIINESIVNALKYAFPHNRPGNVHIRLKHDGSEFLLLTICDNGIGLPSDVQVSDHDSLGFSLMQGLAKQLKGRFTIENNNGVNIMVRFIALNSFQETPA